MYVIDRVLVFSPFGGCLLVCCVVVHPVIWVFVVVGVVVLLVFLFFSFIYCFCVCCV